MTRYVRRHDEAVLHAANFGDDADRTAAVCGQVAGAFYGVGSPIRTGRERRLP
jgi:ADP-ribosyl-[dinitrogen reductase] hydrolase